MIFVIAVPVGVVLSGNEADAVGVTIFVMAWLVGAALTVHGGTTRVRLTDAELVQGSVFVRERWPRDQVVGVRKGRVPWLGGEVSGLVVVLVDGRQVPLRPTAMMGVRCRSGWTALIYDWMREPER